MAFTLIFAKTADEPRAPTYNLSAFTEEMVKQAFGLETVVNAEELLHDWTAAAEQVDITSCGRICSWR